MKVQLLKFYLTTLFIVVPFPFRQVHTHTHTHPQTLQLGWVQTREASHKQTVPLAQGELSALPEQESVACTLRAQQEKHGKEQQSLTRTCVGKTSPPVSHARAVQAGKHCVC